MQGLKYAWAAAGVVAFITMTGMATAQTAPVAEPEDKSQWLVDVLGAEVAGGFATG